MLKPLIFSGIYHGLAYPVELASDLVSVYL
jgi:hypothetical protein